MRERGREGGRERGGESEDKLTQSCKFLLIKARTMY